MYTKAQAAGVTWGSIAALLGTFRSEHPLISFDYVKVLRIVRLSELQSLSVDEETITFAQLQNPNEYAHGVSLAALKREAAVELLRDIQTAESRIKRLKDLEMITSAPNPSRSSGQIIVLTQQGRETLENIEARFCHLFDLLTIQRDERHEPTQDKQAEYSAAERALCDPFSSHHQLPRPGHNRM